MTRCPAFALAVTLLSTWGQGFWVELRLSTSLAGLDAATPFLNCAHVLVESEENVTFARCR